METGCIAAVFCTVLALGSEDAHLLLAFKVLAEPDLICLVAP